MTATAFTTFILFQLFNAVATRNEDGLLVGRRQLRNRTLWICLDGRPRPSGHRCAAARRQGIFDTVSLDPLSGRSASPQRSPWHWPSTAGVRAGTAGLCGACEPLGLTLRPTQAPWGWHRGPMNGYWTRW